MELSDIELEHPIREFVEHQSRVHQVSPEKTVVELVTLGFEALLQQLYDRYRRGEISFGRLADELGITTWELGHLLEERGWVAHNLPS
ncbi:MAG: hypothetical protein ACK2VD_02070 [Anaerolineae bacterium]|jgi:hypothetical protein